MSDLPPIARTEPVRTALWERASIVWVIPAVALLIALGVAWQNYTDRGPLIEIEFENGSGVAAGQTELRYRDVTVGLVEEVRFSDGLDKVLVAVRLEKNVAPFVDVASEFWVVRPQVTARGVTGLDTVLGGVFIEGSWDSTPGEPQTRFSGRNEVPLIRPGEEGLEIVLRSTAQSSLTDNAPILFRGIEVGRIGRARISPQTGLAVAEAIIYRPHDRLITDATRFWDASGFDLTLGAGGAELSFSSFASLVSGGITFDTVVSGGDPVQDGALFQVFPGEAEARASLFNVAEVGSLELMVVFTENVAGLSSGAPVELRGLRIGEVSNIAGTVSRTDSGERRVQLNATLSIQPARLGLTGDADATAALAFLQERVRSGLRARLATASLLTGGLKVELALIEDAPPAEIDMAGDPFPILPSTEGNISDVTATAEGVLTRINDLPIEELMVSAIDLLDAGKVLLSSEDLQQTPGALRGLVEDARKLIASEDMQQVPALLNASMARLDTLLGELETQKAAERLVAALDAAAGAADSVEGAVAGVPALVTQLEGVAAKAENLGLEELLAETTALVATAERYIGADGAADLPEALAEALRELAATLTELREGGVVDSANAALASAREAADSVALAAEDLPALIDRMAGVLARAAATLEDYDSGSDLNREARSALREINDAAKAFQSLARTIERDPNSLLIGR